MFEMLRISYVDLLCLGCPPFGGIPKRRGIIGCGFHKEDCEASLFRLKSKCEHCRLKICKV